VAGDRVVGETPNQIAVAKPRRVLERPDPQMAGRHPGEHRAGEHSIAGDALTGGDHGQCPRRGDVEGVHRLADQQLAQHRPDRRLTVTAASERCRPRTLEVEVATLALGVDDLAQKQRPPVTEAR
jgi:hypothetical protein